MHFHLIEEYPIPHVPPLNLLTVKLLAIIATNEAAKEQNDTIKLRALFNDQ